LNPYRFSGPQILARGIGAGDIFYEIGNLLKFLQFTITKFNQNLANLNLNEVSADDILGFMTQITEGRKPQIDFK